MKWSSYIDKLCWLGMESNNIRFTFQCNHTNRSIQHVWGYTFWYCPQVMTFSWDKTLFSVIESWIGKLTQDDSSLYEAILPLALHRAFAVITANHGFGIGACICIKNLIVKLALLKSQSLRSPLSNLEQLERIIDMRWLFEHLRW